MLEEIFVLLDWIKVKIFLEKKTTHIFFKEKEIWWCGIGKNIGVEMYGKGNRFTRPVLIFKKFSQDSFLRIPLISKNKMGTWYVPMRCLEIEGSLVMNQIRVLDKRRLITRIGTINHEKYLIVRKALLQLFGP